MKYLNNGPLLRFGVHLTKEFTAKPKLWLRHEFLLNTRKEKLYL
jgi:hypothetical protein